MYTLKQMQIFASVDLPGSAHMLVYTSVVCII